MPVTIDQIIRSKRRTMTLIVEHDGSVVVRAPLRASEKSIREFAEVNAAWIEKKRAQARAAVPPTPKQYLSGETFLYLGRAYPLEVVPHQRKALLLDGGFRLAASAQGNAEVVFREWYRRQARKVIKVRVELFAQEYGFQYEKIRITSARTRWGSCSATGALNFSWRLIMTPLEVVDYVVVHELVHTVVHSHSRRFWGKVAKIMPNYKEHNKWLRKNGGQVML